MRLLEQHPALVPYVTMVADGTGSEMALLQQAFPQWQRGDHYIVVMDQHTYAACGERLVQAWQAQVDLSVHVLDALTLKPRIGLSANIAAAARERSTQGLIAVGSGTLNDLVKYAAFLTQLPYVVFATAASMNGYLSANASLIASDGLKTTKPAVMPAQVVVDMQVVRSAPERLAKAGLGDALCRSTAQVDWLLSHLLFETPYMEELFARQAPSEAVLMQTNCSPSHAPDAWWSALMENLLLSGLGMTEAGGSYPASQGEHMLAHCDEMIRHGKHAAARTQATAQEEAMHGEAIAVTTMMVVRHHMFLLNADTAPRLHNLTPPTNMMRELFGDALTLSALVEFEEKRNRIGDLMHAQRKLDDLWPKIKEACLKHHLSEPELRAPLHAAEIALTPQALGWDEDYVQTLWQITRFTRGRFTMLDLHIAI